MATGGTPFDDSAEELHNWTVTNGSLVDRLNNMDWGVHQNKANRSTEKNKKKLSAAVVESRLTNDISPESTPGAGRRRARTPHSFPHIKYSTQMSVPDQAELDKLRQRINFTDLDERSVGSDSQGRVTTANNQRQLAGENKKPYNFLPLHVNTNKSKELLPPSSSAPATPAITKETRKHSQGLRETLTTAIPTKEPARPDRSGTGRDLLALRQLAIAELRLDSSQVVGKVIQIREYISKASSMLEDLMEKNDVPANVERLSHLINHLKEQERSYLRFLQKMLARENEEEDVGTGDSAVGSESQAESTCLNTETGRAGATGSDQKEELDNLRKQHELLKKMLEQQEQLRALQGQQEALMALQGQREALMALQHNAELAFEDNVVTETTGSVSGLSITSELNDELNELIQRYHNQLHDSQSKAVPDNRRQAESLSLSREVCWARSPQAVGPPQHRPLLHSASGPHTGLDTGAAAASVTLTKLQELQDKKQTMDKILQELHSLRDQTLNNSRRGMSAQLSVSIGGSSDVSSNGASAPVSRHALLAHQHETSHSADKLRKLKEVHKRLNELRELVQYYEQTSDMMVDAVNENVKRDDEEEEEDDEENPTEDSSIFEAVFDSERESHRPVTNIRNSQGSRNWAEMNSLTNRHGLRSGTSNNRDGRLNTECEINNRLAANLRSLAIPLVIECQYNRNIPYDPVKDEDEDEEGLGNEVGAQAMAPDSEASQSSRRSSTANDARLSPNGQRLTAKQKLRQLQELVAMVQSDDTDATTANEDEALDQQPNNTRGPVPSAPGTLSLGCNKSPRSVSLSTKAREKLYEEKLRQQKEELKQLHEERQRLIEIQGKIQDLQWACPDFQSSVSNSTNQQGLLKKAPLAVSTPAAGHNSASSAHKTNSAVLKPTAPEAAISSVTDKELWSEMRRHQMLREELRQRRKHLESLMAEHQRRSGHEGSPSRIEDQEGIGTPSQTVSTRTVATWGSTPCCHDDDTNEEEENGDEHEYRSEISEEAQEVCTESSSDEDIHDFSQNRNQSSYSNRKNQESNLQPPEAFLGDVSGCLHNKARQQQSTTQHGSAQRQENLRWASELSVAEGSSSHWQEQISNLQSQLDFSSSMCQTLMQDQQTLSYMLQTLLTGQFSVLPNNVSSPQVIFVMHQLNQCYTQLAWQQNNVQRLKQVLNDLVRQQQLPPCSSSAAGWQTQKKEPISGPFLSPGAFASFSSTQQPPPNNLPPTGLFPFPHSLNVNPVFPAAPGGFAPTVTEQPSAVRQKDHNVSLKTEYMSFPPPLQRSPLNTSTDRRPAGLLNTSQTNNALHHLASKSEPQESLSSSPMYANCRSQPQDFDKVSEGSFSSMLDPVDPSTITKTFKTGRKASAQANLASRSKTPKSRRRRNKGHSKTCEGHESDSVSSSAELAQQRAVLSHHKDQNQSLLDKLTQEKLKSKTKLGNKRNDLSSAYAWRTPFLSNRIACTEAPDASSDFSLFEALRETIYSEVATLISQNESRPHFLIELFHELQLLNTDYLRQRALYSLQDLVARHLAEKSSAQECLVNLGPGAWAAGSQSELTPSESLTTSDAEVAERSLSLSVMKTRAEADSVDEDSIMSTSSNMEPFANEELGTTVIHLDKALARIRDYERTNLKAGPNRFNNSNAAAVHSEASNAAKVEEGGAGGVHCPQIDTQQLDREIKVIMAEVIPFLKENMDDVCSPQLLTSVRRMVLALTQLHDDGKEFVHFFHRELGGILQESLSKFLGRTLKDCGEDLLVAISEILFNELAFFRLMQDLDSSSSSSSVALAVKHLNEKRDVQLHKARNTQKENTADGGNKPLSPPDTDEGKEEDEAEQEGAAAFQLYLQTDTKTHWSSPTSEGDDEEDEDSQGVPLSISLSKAEVQALTNYGSGEDEMEEEMEEFDAPPVDVQTSLQVSADGYAEQKGRAEGTAEIKPEQKDPQTEIIRSSGTEQSVEHRSLEEEEQQQQQLEEEEEEVVEEDNDNNNEEKNNADAVPGSGGSSEDSHSQGFPKDPPASSSPDSDSPVMINVEEVSSGNTSQKSDEDDFVKVDDLPLQLTVMCQEELQKRIVEEQQNNNLSAEILNGNTEHLTGLAGSAQALKEPEAVVDQNLLGMVEE
ncbi:pericentriolar material 1 protein isoform X2 [Gouania willdenowi]|uniref:pericentriolar material 1 protein isoform X2 n=1 Tax=Gouania willdenowi TaxID=441366 RepID=UPI00105443DC|nr:pericentriolar material 1 protein isoform X2 [Gouania willdenowi]